MNDTTNITNDRKTMEKVYDKACDKNVRAVKVYADAGKAYTDAAKTAQFGATALADAFEKGCVIIAAGVEYKPVAMEALSSGKTRSLVYFTFTASQGATTATPAKVESGADPA